MAMKPRLQIEEHTTYDAPNRRDIEEAFDMIERQSHRIGQLYGPAATAALDEQVAATRGAFDVLMQCLKKLDEEQAANSEIADRELAATIERLGATVDVVLDARDKVTLVLEAAVIDQRDKVRKKRLRNLPNWVFDARVLVAPAAWGED